MAILKSSHEDVRQKMPNTALGDFDPSGILSSGGYDLPKPDPDWRKSMISLAEAQLRHDRPADAVPTLVMLCRTDESDHYAARLLALAFARSDKWEEAQSILDKVSGQKSPPDTPVLRAWNKIKRLVYIFWKLSVALIKFSAEKLHGFLRECLGILNKN